MVSQKEAQKWLEKYRRDRIGKAQKICETLDYFSKSLSDPLILDIGSYEGKMEEQFTKRTKNMILGIEISFKAIRTATENARKMKLNNVGFIVGDAKALPIRNNKIDWIICNQVIDCLQDKDKVVKEFERTLKQNGWTYLSTGSILFLKLYKILPFLFVRYLGPFYGRFMTSTSSDFISPMNYNFWKKTILEKTNLTIRDITPDLILDENSKIYENKGKIRNKITRIIYRIIRNWSPTWVFILSHKVNETEK